MKNMQVKVSLCVGEGGLKLNCEQAGGGGGKRI